MALPEGVILEVALDCKDWQHELPEFQYIIDQAVDQVSENVSEGRSLAKFSHIEVGVVLCDDALMHKLNNDYREQDKATNVLSFEGLDEEQVNLYLRSEIPAPEYPVSLGEIYVAFETTVKEANAGNILLKNHFTHLVIHGMLHLLGYDHVENDEAELMEAIEIKLLDNLAIDDPYAA